MNEQAYDVILTGSDGPVEGIARPIVIDGYTQAYEFISVDETITLVVALSNGQWVRIAGSDPYFTGWADELAEQITKQNTL
ncbi:hypothetical protein [Mucilaginibacter sp. KACC 22063]|uniref:hypothetical protein n=1 Tax=Mucilaginibacter sp. KACC 22063 TaxID=3025666 RepID=UPI002367257B|nr:hypothetical protein [Mucilaginibacter sp. KACC 22063]WDF53968.1 hypothetical protein PQ461_13555 [Mucilaginibacter sp. KACC 22063]